MSSPGATLIAWDDQTGDEIGRVHLSPRPIVSDSTAVLIGFENGFGQDFVIPAEWAGKKIAILVSPKAVTSDPMTMALADLAIRMGVPVG